MKDIENIIINEEESLNENSGNCHTEFEGGKVDPCVCVCVCMLLQHVSKSANNLSLQLLGLYKTLLKLKMLTVNN